MFDHYLLTNVTYYYIPVRFPSEGLHNQQVFLVTVGVNVTLCWCKKLLVTSMLKKSCQFLFVNIFLRPSSSRSSLAFSSLEIRLHSALDVRSSVGLDASLFYNKQLTQAEFFHSILKNRYVMRTCICTFKTVLLL